MSHQRSYPLSQGGDKRLAGSLARAATLDNVVPGRACTRVIKVPMGELKKDGSNFFQIATQVR
jgi:hypothetical protein